MKISSPLSWSLGGNQIVWQIHAKTLSWKELYCFKSYRKTLNIQTLLVYLMLVEWWSSPLWTSAMTSCLMVSMLSPGGMMPWNKKLSQTLKANINHSDNYLMMSLSQLGRWGNEFEAFQLNLNGFCFDHCLWRLTNCLQKSLTIRLPCRNLVKLTSTLTGG